MTRSEVPAQVLAAGYASIEAVEMALANLRDRRERAIDQRISVSSLGGDDLGGGMRAEQWRHMNDSIDTANSLAALETEISRLGRLLAEARGG